MSWIWTVMLSFSSDEYWEEGEDEPRETCEPLERINNWIKDGRLISLTAPTYKGDAGYGMDADLFGGGFKHFDIAGFIEVVKAQPWKCRELVQLWVKADGDEPFILIDIGLSDPLSPESTPAVTWNLDDSSAFESVVSFTVKGAFTWGTNRDRENREKIRAAALPKWTFSIQKPQWWAFRIVVKKGGKRPFDIDNVPKLIVDSFCVKQILQDSSQYEDKHLGLYEDDSIKEVRYVQVYGEPTDGPDEMLVSIYGRRGP